MISFVVPGAFLTPTPPDTETVITVNTNPNLDTTVRKMEQKYRDFLIEESRVDGINSIEQKFAFSVGPYRNVTIQGIDAYFKSLKGTGKLTITFPGLTKNFTITTWSIVLINALYSKLDAQAELVFL